MSATLHPNMFPGVAELTAADELAEAAAGALPSEPASETHFASNISPWANPSESLQKAATPGEVASGEETAKQPTTTERVAKYLRTHGPSSGRAICDTLGIHSTAGIQPFIKAALRKGHILHDGVQYMLPEQRTSDASDAIPAAPARGTRKKAAPPVAQAEQRGAEPVATTPPAPVAHALGTDAPRSCSLSARPISRSRRTTQCS